MTLSSTLSPGHGGGSDANWVAFAFLSLAVVVLSYFAGVTGFLQQLVVHLIILCGGYFLVRKGDEARGSQLLAMFGVQLAIYFVLSMVNGELSWQVVITENLLPVLAMVLVITLFYSFFNKVDSSFVQQFKTNISAVAQSVGMIGVIGGLIIFGASDAFWQYIEPYLATFKLFHTILLILAGNIWFIWAMNHASNEGKTVGKLIFGGIFVLLLFSVSYGLLTSGILDSYRDAEAYNDYPALFEVLWEQIKEAFNKTREGIEISVNQTTTGYNQIRDPHFAERAEKTADLGDVGVRLGKPFGSQAQFEQGKVAEIFTQVDAIAIDKPIEVNTTCFVRMEDTQSRAEWMQPFDIVDGKSFTVFSNTPRTILCRIPANESAMFSGRGDFVFNATYTWSTSGYTRRYYIAKSTLDNLAQYTDDPIKLAYDQFDIPSDERNPKSIYTTGPLELIVGTLGTGQGGQTGGMQGVSTEGGDRVEFWLQLKKKNSLKGGLDKINRLYFFVPPGIFIDESGGEFNCNYEVEELADDKCYEYCSDDDVCRQTCDVYDAYAVVDETFKVGSGMRCTMLTESSRILLEGSQLGIKTFGATIDYVINATTVTTIEMKKNANIQEGTQIERFTDLRILTAPADFAEQGFEDNKADILANVGSYTWSTDKTQEYLLKGVYAYFYIYHQNKHDYCVDRVPYAGLIGLTPPDIFSQTTCPEDKSSAKSANEQIAVQKDRMAQHMESCDSVECVVGKTFCGMQYNYPDYGSCSNGVSCSFCTDRLIPGVVTYAQNIFGSDTVETEEETAS